MSHADILTAAKLTATGRLPVLRELMALGCYGRRYRLNAPALIGLTLVSRIAEGLAVGLIVLFLDLTLGGGAPDDQPNAMVQHFTDAVARITGGSMPLLGGAILVVVLVRIVVDGIVGFLDSKIYNEIADEVRRDLHSQYFRVSYDYIAKHDHADLMNVIENESEHVPEAFQSILEMIQDLVAVLVFGVLVALVSWQVGLVAAVGGVALLLIARFMSQPIESLNGLAIAQHRRMMQRILNGLQGMRAIRAFGQEPTEKARFARVSRKLRDTHRRIDILQTLIDPVNELGYLALMALLVAAGVWFSPSLTATLTALALLYRLQPHASALQGRMISLITMTPHLSVVRSVLDPSDKTYLPDGSEPFAGLNEAIRFQGVTMAYPGTGHSVLKDVAFSIPAGRTTALLGASGAGKSTIVNLLLRLYEPDAGEIMVDRRRLAGLSRADWLSRVALAGQDVDLVEGTVATNIRLSRPSASRADVRRAAEIAGILEDIDALEHGFGAWVGERGLMLSGGQRQRIGLARAILADPQVLILDEAMSALDEPLEEKIRQRLRTEFAGRTLIIITHRTHTVSAVDHVVWLEKGRVVEEGAPAALARLSGSGAVRIKKRDRAG
jgi:ABC-type multidrug transport system fused ATPase/permease subunit